MNDYEDMNQPPDELNPNSVSPATPQQIGTTDNSSLLPSNSDRLYDAQVAGNKQEYMSQLLRSFQNLIQNSAPHSGFKADNSISDVMSRQAAQMPANVKEQLTAEANDHKEKMTNQKFQMDLMKSKLDFQDMQANSDPSSPQSQIAQNRVIEKQKELGQPVNEDQIRTVSGKDLYPMFKYLQEDLSTHYKLQQEQAERTSREDYQNKHLAQQERMLNETVASRKEVAKMNADAKTEAKREKTVDNLTEKMKNDLDPDKAKTGNFGKNQAQVYQADRLRALYTESNGDIRNLDSRQMEELAIGMNKMLSGSSASSVTQVNALVPHSVRGNAQKLKEWLINEPEGTDQVEFVRRMAETIDRERDIAAEQVKVAQIRRLGSYKKLKDLAPDAYEQNLNSYGIDPNEIDEKGQYKGGLNKSLSAAPYGDTTVRNGKTYKWNAAVGKYQLLGQ